MKKYFLLLIIILLCGCENEYYCEEGKVLVGDECLSCPEGYAMDIENRKCYLIDTDNDDENDIQIENDYKEDLTIHGEKGYSDNYWYYVTGFLTNNSNYTYEEIVIQYIALDSEGYNLSTCSDIAYNLKPGEEYAFKATCVTDKNNVSSFKLKMLTPVD